MSSQRDCSLQLSKASYISTRMVGLTALAAMKEAGGVTQITIDLAVSIVMGGSGRKPSCSTCPGIQ